MPNGPNLADEFLSGHRELPRAAGGPRLHAAGDVAPLSAGGPRWAVARSGAPVHSAHPQGGRVWNLPPSYNPMIQSAFHPAVRLAQPQHVGLHHPWQHLHPQPQLQPQPNHHAAPAVVTNQSPQEALDPTYGPRSQPDRTVSNPEPASQEPPASLLSDVRVDADQIRRLLEADDDPLFQQSEFMQLLNDLSSDHVRISETQNALLADMGPTEGGTDHSRLLPVLHSNHGYEIETRENPFEDSRDPFEEGLRLMREGNLSMAVRAFEQAVKRDSDHVDAWRYLGQCHAENEDEPSAIKALHEAVERDPFNLDAILLLAVSFTNEIERRSALDLLRSWIESHPSYLPDSSAAAADSGAATDHLGAGPVHHIVRQFERAVQANPTDVDLHTALGVLFNISMEYDRAAEHLRLALAHRPTDASLWNKLGATLANGQRSDEAVDAYRRALRTKPNYVRALANLGIAFSNLSRHEEACQSYLASLDKNPRALTVWSHLRMSLIAMDRDDLVKLTEKRSIDAFRPHFNF